MSKKTGQENKPSVQPCRPSQAKVRRSTVKDYHGVLEKLHKLVLSSRSPSGTLKVLQNKAGGNLVLTSSSRRLIQSLTVRKPVIQMLVSATQGHLELYGDSGLFSISFATDMVLQSIKSGINSRILAEIFESFLSYIHNFLTCDMCRIKYSALIGDIDFMMNFVKSIIKPKHLCGLNESTMPYISNLLLQVFLQTITENETCTLKENIFVLPMEGWDVSESKAYNGLLLEAPDLSRFKKTELEFIRMSINGKSRIQVAMVTASLSGDVDELSNVKYEVRDNLDPEKEVLDNVAAFCKSVILCNVGLLLCQKVVHPLIKLQLREAGVHVVDRVGLHMVKFVNKLTGSRAIQCLDGNIQSKYCGWVEDVQHVILNKRSFLHLTRGDNCVSTLVLCQQQEQQLEELKCVCEASLSSLEKLMFDPYVLPGGGCWQALVARYLSSKVQREIIQMSEELECHTHCIQEACSIFTQSLMTASLTCPSKFQQNSRSLHVHISHGENTFDCGEVNKVCQCGLFANKPGDTYTFCSNFNNTGVEIENSHDVFDWESSGVSQQRTELETALASRSVVFDGAGMSQNALQTAVLTACSLLRVGQVMENF